MKEAFVVRMIHLLLAFYFISPKCFATTFGPINIHDQIKSVSLVLHGKISRGPWAEQDRKSKRPYTYWNLNLLEDYSAENLGSDVLIRRSGGEINGIGFFTAGSANFKIDEEVFVLVNHTSEENVKEVVGLASGKYRVLDNGKKIQNGIGFIVSKNGVPLSSKEFSLLISRVRANKATQADKALMLNNQVTHDEETVLDKPTQMSNEITKETKMASTNKSQGGDHENTQTLDRKSVQDKTNLSDESIRGSQNWIIPVGIAIIAFFLGTFFILRRK